jgi:uncharacterized protein
MSLSLYDTTVLTYLQMLGAVERVLARGLEHCSQHGHDPEALVETRLYHDMLPLRFQVLSTIKHSIGAIEGVRKGSFSPAAKGDHDYAALQKAVAEASAALKEIKPEEVNGFTDRDVLFETGDVKLPFTAQDFLLTFSLPNFYFHATTTYGILRSKGVPLGKKDFLGRMRIKR